MYLNGELDNIISATGSLSKHHGSLNIGGGDPYSDFFNGTLDEVGIYNRALTSYEIADYITVSQGLVTVQPKPDDALEPADIVKRADKALYEAKGLGRNAIAVASD